MNVYVMHFNEVDRRNLPEVGGKGANLGEMSKAGFPVSPGFCVTTSGYRDFIAESGEMDELLDLLARLKPNQTDEINRPGTADQGPLANRPHTPYNQIVNH